LTLLAHNMRWGVLKNMACLRRLFLVFAG